METFKPVTCNNVDENSRIIKFDTVKSCPICKRMIEPVYMASSIDSSSSASIFYFCRGCENAFIAKYSGHISGQVINGKYSFITKDLISVEPNRFEKFIFDEKICNLSPQFDKIYNQALSAESLGLDEIAGLGYRKSVEFLVKDFAIYENPDNEEAIKAKPLAQCIKSYIDDSRIKTLAERSAWIGNDEAHYIRKQEDRDVSDMKKFIQAIVYFIGMVLITEDADSMTSK